MQDLLIALLLTTEKADRPRNEMDLIEARITSARKWAARRRMLRLRVAVFGRRKLRERAEATENEGGTCAGAAPGFT